MWRRGVTRSIRLEGLMVNDDLTGWWLMTTQKFEHLEKLFHNIQGSTGKDHGNLNHPPVQGRSNHSYQPWQTVPLNWHNLIHSHLSTIIAYKGKSSKQAVNTIQFPVRNKTCGGGQACGCAKLASPVWPPGAGEPPRQWKEAATGINVGPDDIPAFVSKRATVHSHWAQTLLLGIVLSPAVILAFQTRTCVQQLARDHWPKIKHHHSTTPSWVWYIVVVHYPIPEWAQVCWRIFFLIWEMTFLYWECNTRIKND